MAVSFVDNPYSGSVYNTPQGSAVLGQLGNVASPFGSYVQNYQQQQANAPAAGVGSGTGFGAWNMTGTWNQPGTLPPRMDYPQGQLQYMKGDATNYPTFMRSLGENAAQQAFQRAQGQMVAGRSPQQFAAAQDALNQARLGYMSQAGQQAFNVASGQEQAQMNLYNAYLQQRAQDIAYLNSMRGAAAGENVGMMRNPDTGVSINVPGRSAYVSPGSSQQQGAYRGLGTATPSGSGYRGMGSTPPTNYYGALGSSSTPSIAQRLTF